MRQEWKYDPGDLAPYFWGALGCICVGWYLNGFWSLSVAFGVGILAAFFCLALESERPGE